MPENLKPWLTFMVLDGLGLTLVLVGWVVLDDGSPTDIVGMFSNMLQVWVTLAGLALSLFGVITLMWMLRRR
jgi:hypothetical protein